MLAGIDYFIVIAYIVGILMLGYYFKRFVSSSKDYFLGGKSLPFWAIGMSIVVSDIGAMDFVGVSGQAYRYGISVGNFDWIGSVPAMLLAAFIFILTSGGVECILFLNTLEEDIIPLCVQLHP